MNRVDLPEFLDFEWFPNWLKTAETNLIVVLARMLKAGDVLASLVSRATNDGEIDHIVDLGSGAGGPMPDVVRRLRESPETAGITLTMSDLYPNLDAIRALNMDGQNGITYLPDPVDAKDLASAPPGLRTMINCFHHLRPDEARSVLASAQASGEPLLIYEMSENILPLWLWWVTLPLSLPMSWVLALGLTPFVRPMTLRQLFFSYVIPIIPICFAWDGQASAPRLYSLEDMDELVESLESRAYLWEKGIARTRRGRSRGTYLLGRPAPTRVAKTE